MTLINEIENKLKKELLPIEFGLWDESEEHIGHTGNIGGGGHFYLRVVSTKFCNLKRIDRHKLVYKILEGYIPDKIHAISVLALTPDESKL